VGAISEFVASQTQEGIMNTSIKSLLTGIAIAVIGLAVAPSVEAASIFIYDGVNPIVIVNDNGVGDANPVVGEITHFGTLGSFVDLEIALTKPSVGSPTAPAMGFSFIAASASTTPTFLQIGFSETGFGPTSPIALVSASGTAAGNVTYTTLQDPNNVLFAGNQITTASSGPGIFAFSDVALISGNGATTGPYSLTQVFTIIHPGGSGIQRTEITADTVAALIVLPGIPVPDGGFGVGLLGFGLMGVEGLRRKYTRL
jgi:hypothetical protein